MNKTSIDPAKYPIEVHYSEEDGGFIALARDLPGCSAFGKTQAKAVAEMHHAIQAWQAAATAANNPVPEPSRLSEDILPGGRILLRLPRSLHALLIEGARSENVSLNQHVVSLLSAGASIKQIYQYFSRALSASSAVWPTVEAKATFTPFRMISGSQVQQTTVRSDTLVELLKKPPNQPVIQRENL